ncbi:MAG: PIN domain-containing protein [Hyphomicrobium sp.]
MTIIPFDEADAVDATDIRALLTRAARRIGPYDLLIAAQARRRNVPLVTLNRREFERMAGLMVTDWGIAS